MKALHLAILALHANVAIGSSYPNCPIGLPEDFEALVEAGHLEAVSSAEGPAYIITDEARLMIKSVTEYTEFYESVNEGKKEMSKLFDGVRNGTASFFQGLADKIGKK